MEEIFSLDDEIPNAPIQIELISKEKKSFLVDREIAVKSSRLIKAVLENDSTVMVIPLYQINASIMELIMMFMKYDGPDKDDEIPIPLPNKEMKEIVGEWRASFLDIEKTVLFDLILASHYLDMDSLLRLACSKVALLLRGKTVEEIKDVFKL